MSFQDELLRQQSSSFSARRKKFESQIWGECKDSRQAKHIPRRSRDNGRPLSFSQERIWFLDQLEPGNPANNLSVAYRTKGPINTVALERGLTELVRRHEVLRMTFASVNGQPVQALSRAPNTKLTVIDLQGHSEAEREAEAQRLAAEEAQQPFDLALGPLLRAKLLRLSQDEHVLVVTMHRIACDDWSVGVFMGELATLYGAFAAQEPSPLPELPIQYADLAHWQRQSLQGEAPAPALDYWKQQLGGEPAVLQLPTDRPRAPVRTHRNTRQSLLLSQSLTGALEALSGQEQVTLFMTLLAAFKTLLYRYSGEQEITVGSPVSGRTCAEADRLIGPLANTLVLRTSFSGIKSFQELLGRVREQVLGAYAHQSLPFEKLIEELQLERDLTRPPLVQVGFRMLHSTDDQIELAGLQVQLFLIPESYSELDLTLYAQEREAGIEITLAYDGTLYAHERMAEMLDQFAHLLEQVVERPQDAIQSYSLVTSSARSLLPDPSMPLPDPWHEPITTILRSWMNETTDRPAIRQGDRSWTYRDLGRRTNALAHALLAHGVERGNVVAVSGTRSFGVIAGMVGALLSGGVLLNLDPNLPRSRQEQMLQEARAKHLLYVGTPHPADAWMWETMTVIRVDPLSGQMVDLDETGLKPGIALPEVAPQDAAYLFFTSGTTGVPKGVLGCHKGLAHFIAWQRQAFEIGPSDRSAQLTGLSFDVVLRDVFTPLTSGATLCLPLEEDRLEPARLISWLECERVTMLHTVPSLAQSWLASVPPEVSLRALRLVFFAGEPLTKTLVDRWRQAFPQAGEIVNLYGPTETTMAKCYFRVPPEPLPGIQPVGTTLPETQALVFNQENRLCGIGEPGEIVIRTPFRSLGYINASDENRRRFVKNPFRDDEQDLLYYTGDRGRYRPNGTLDILGRVDHQVKLRGVRIELGEVETTLSQHPGVWNSVALVREDVPGDKRLVAYVTARPGQSLTTYDLRRFLQQKLPDPMVPSALVVLDTLPLTPNGKIDRRALPVPDSVRPDLEADYIAPRTEVERTIATAWQEALNIEKAGVDDNFFDLGGHSLLLAQVKSKLAEALDRDVPVVEFFRYPTIRSLAEYLNQDRHEQPVLHQVHERAQVRRALMRQRRRARTNPNHIEERTRE